MNTKTYFTLLRKGCYWIDEETNEKYVWHEAPEDFFTGEEAGCIAWIVDIISEDEVIVTTTKESERII